MSVRVSGALHATSFCHLRATGRNEKILLDLSGVYFASPAGLVALCTTLELLVRSGGDLEVLAPANDDVSRYMSRAHVPGVLDQLGIRHNFGSVRERFQGSNLVEIRTFDDSATVVALADGIHAFAERHDGAVAGELHVAVCEAGDNVSSHSKALHGYLMAQYFPTKRAFEFALGDCGIGLLESLQGQGALDDLHAIQMAVTPGVTSTADSKRGYGLSSIRANLARIGGSLTITTGNAFRTYSSGTPSGSAGAFFGEQKGTLITGRLPSAA